MNKPTRFLPVLFACALLLPSCATRITGSLQAEGRADFNVFAALEPRMAALLTGFALAGGAAPGAPILDGPSIALSMAGAPGVSSAAFANASPVSIEGRVQSSDIGEFLSGAAGAEAYGSFERFAGGGGRFSLGLDRASGRQMLALISPDITNYLSALLAPVATGEAMTRAAYLGLLGLVYGQAIADEIASATVRAWIEFPGPIESIVGGEAQGRVAEFVIPLVDVMVLEETLRYEVIWR